MERTIDHHDSQKITRVNVNRLLKWRDAWTACYNVIENYSSPNLRGIHTVIGQWISILNWVFGNPIHPLRQYVPFFYYCGDPNGPKEILHAYMDPSTGENGERFIHIVFNLYEFNKLHRNFCNNTNRECNMLVDEARGTINFSMLEETTHNPAEYFKHMAIWQLLFLFTIHFMAHWDTFDKYQHASYDTHMRVRESDFYNLHFAGTITYPQQ